MKQEFHVKQKFCLVNSYRNTISKWALGFRYGNFFIPRVEKNLKISPWEGNSNLPRAYGPWEDRVSSLGLIFGGFFNPWDEEISIPDINGHSENLFLFEFIYVQNLFFSVKSSCALVTRGEMVISHQARILPGEKLPFPPG